MAADSMVMKTFTKPYLDHSQALLEQLNIQRFYGAFCDIILRVEDYDFKAHKCVLASFSVKLQSMLFNMRQECGNVLALKDVSVMGLKHVIEYLYTGSLKLEAMSLHVHDILSTAQYLEIREVEKACLEYFKHASSPQAGSVHSDPAKQGLATNTPNSNTPYCTTPQPNPQPGPSQSTLPPPPVHHPSPGMTFDTNYIEDYLKLIESLQGDQMGGPGTTPPYAKDMMQRSHHSSESSNLPPSTNQMVNSSPRPLVFPPTSNNPVGQYSGEEIRRNVLNILSQEKFMDDAGSSHQESTKTHSPLDNAESGSSHTHTPHAIPTENEQKRNHSMPENVAETPKEKPPADKAEPQTPENNVNGSNTPKQEPMYSDRSDSEDAAEGDDPIEPDPGFGGGNSDSDDEWQIVTKDEDSEDEEMDEEEEHDPEEEDNEIEDEEVKLPPRRRSSASKRERRSEPPPKSTPKKRRQKRKNKTPVRVKREIEEDPDFSCDEQDDSDTGISQKRADEYSGRGRGYRKRGRRGPAGSRIKDKKKIMCERCGRLFGKQDALTRHLELHDREMLFACHVCNLKYSRSAELTRHMRTHSGELFRCIHCEKEFQAPREYKQHMEKEHGETKPFYCTFPGCKFKSNKPSNVEKHALIHCDIKMYHCHHCGKSFAQQNGLRSHLRSCLQKRDYLCDHCGAKFNHLQSLKSHRMLHTGEKPHRCVDCGARFTDHRNFKRHRRIHENAYPYPCTFCDKRFRHSNSLKAHLKTHNLTLTQAVTEWLGERKQEGALDIAHHQGDSTPELPQHPRPPPTTQTQPAVRPPEEPRFPDVRPTEPRYPDIRVGDPRFHDLSHLDQRYQDVRATDLRYPEDPRYAPLRPEDARYMDVRSDDPRYHNVRQDDQRYPNHANVRPEEARYSGVLPDRYPPTLQA